jgi:hypothetical protein
VSQHSPTTFTLLSVDRAMRNAPFPDGRDGAPSPSVSRAKGTIISQRRRVTPDVWYTGGAASLPF